MIVPVQLVNMLVTDKIIENARLNEMVGRLALRILLLLLLLLDITIQYSYGYKCHPDSYLK